jgi:hypothetical protein
MSVDVNVTIRILKPVDVVFNAVVDPIGAAGTTVK